MSFPVGAKLGPYEITSLIGQGGMGEVYRARDTKLGRDVALKVLPEAFASDPERLARFGREAKVLASLNHPNIAAIYGFEESSGADFSPRGFPFHALVMELVEGQTLADRIVDAVRTSRVGATLAVAQRQETEAGTRAASAKAAALPIDEALPIAKQIAEALEYAHERGIVHRDLKPANIKITSDGVVKLLDFGLAKALEGDIAQGDISTSPTISRMATRAGIILGTAAYMSPEQAKGRPVDRRADIWAFGCVLYEMLTGRKPFEGETISDVLAAVIRAEPDWSALPETTPASVLRLIRRCLQKDPRQRLQAIGDARIAIEETLSGDVGAGLAPAQAEKVPARAAESRLRLALPWVVAAAGLIAAAAMVVIYFRRPSAAPSSVYAFIAPPEKASFDVLANFGAPTLSPDGERLVFPATDDSGKEALWVRPLNSLAAQHLQGTEDAAFPFWSPDSRNIGFFQNGKLLKIDVTGGPPVLICDVPNGRGGAWGRKGVIIFSSGTVGTGTGTGLFSVPAAGGTPTSIAAREVSGGAFSNRWPVFLPDGRHFLYLSGELDLPGTSNLGIYIGEIGSSEEKFLLQADSDALYAAPGYLVFLRGSTLMAQRFYAESQTLEGEALPIAENVGSPLLFRLGLFGVSQTGLLVYSTTRGETGQLVWMNDNGKEIGKLGPADAYHPRLSPDGKQLAYLAENSTGRADLWLMDLARGVQTRFTFGPIMNSSPVWSPDGARIAYRALHQGQDDIFVKDTSGAGSAEPLIESPGLRRTSDWSHDGRYIAFTYANLGSSATANFGIWILPLFGNRKPFPYLQSPQFIAGGAVFSPNGRWIAYQSNESGNFEIYLSPFPNAGSGKWQVSQGGGGQPEWNRDGSALYYLAPGGKLMEASVNENGAAVEISTPRELFQASFVPPHLDLWTYTVAPDGKRFLVDEDEQGAAPPLTLVTNWTAGLPQK